MPQSTSAIIAARRIAARAPDQAIFSPRNLGVTFALIMTLSAGCRLEVGGLLIEATGPGAGGASSTGSHTSEASTGGGESMSGGGNPSSSASGPCMATGAEVCNDGIDNDCNGSVDCADPACKPGFVCAPAIPSGWKAVAFSPKGKTGCPSGYTPVDVSSVTSKEFDCTCNCTQTSPPSCTQGTIDIISNGACTKAVRSLSGNGGACFNLNMDLNTLQNGLVKIERLPPTQGSCEKATGNTIQSPTEGTTCRASLVGAGCANSGACVASPQAPLTSCIEHDGKADCPSTYPKHFSVGTSAQDTRSCTPCACGTMATCTNPKLTLYSDPMCMGGDHDLPVTGMCDSVNDGSGHPYKSYVYSATVVNPTCQKLPDTAPMGSLNLTEERTICCP